MHIGLHENLQCSKLRIAFSYAELKAAFCVTEAIQIYETLPVHF